MDNKKNFLMKKKESRYIKGLNSDVSLNKLTSWSKKAKEEKKLAFDCEWDHSSVLIEAGKKQ